MGPGSLFLSVRLEPKTMEVEAQVAHFRRLSTAVLCQWSEVRARTRAVGRKLPAPLLPPTPIVLTPVSPPSGRHFCETAQLEPRVARLPAEVASRLPAGCQVARLPGCQVARLPVVASGCQRLPAKVASHHVYVLATAVASWLPGCQQGPGCQRLPV